MVGGRPSTCDEVYLLALSEAGESQSQCLVSIVLPTFNRAHTLRRAIDSVLAQTYQHFRLVVVDDGSSDHTPELLSALTDPRVECITLAANAGVARARNIGIEATNSTFVAFQDSDDEWLPNKLEEQMNCLLQNSQVGVVYCDMVRITNLGAEYVLRAPDSVTSILISPELRYCVQDIGIQSAVVRRSELLKSGLFDEQMPALEDLELFIRLSRVTTFVHRPLPLVRYHENPGISTDRHALGLARQKLLDKYASELRNHKKFVASELVNIAGLLHQQETEA